MAGPEIPKTMKAVQVIEYKNPYEIRTVPVPTDLKPTDLLVKVAVASNCHTDSMVQQGVFGGPLPQTASHEGSGTVVAVGSDTEAAKLGFQVGTRVMVGIPLGPCGTCGDCRGPEGQTQYCTQVEGMVGVHIDGCFAEYVRADARTSTPLPDTVSFLSAAPLACAGRTVWRAVLQAELKKGQWVAVVGSGGGLGHLGLQFAKARGLRVIGIDAREEGLELTRKHGADVVVDARKGKEEAVKEVQAVTGGEGAYATINLSDAPTAAALACAVTRMHGTMVQIAQPDEISVPFPEIIFRDIRIKGSLICSNEESKGMMQAIAEHGVTAKTVPFQGLDKIFDLVDMVHSGKVSGKAVIIVDGKQIEEEKKLGARF
ncbi:hypothetical protein LTR62_006583 [Meristemomyces frigidus]|uniref:Enoyl reductase (ER) domain-containing protein n=1 Tax=Meristemomyces frigidus TaxID=1508187 RepID=A0AAN7YEC3_9PEZI|nr:hypothetical protein LTR62_006583 [Meristemomyces frigidus]